MIEQWVPRYTGYTTTYKYKLYNKSQQFQNVLASFTFNKTNTFQIGPYYKGMKYKQCVRVIENIVFFPILNPPKNICSICPM